MKVIKTLALFTWTLLTFCISSSPLEATWGPAVTISEAASNFPQVGTDSSCQAIAVWEQFDGTHTNIQSSQLPPGGSWTTPFNVANAVGAFGSAPTPQIAVDSTGYAVATWASILATTTIEASTVQFGGSWATPVTVTGVNSNSLTRLAITGAGNAVALFIETPTNGMSSTLPFGGSWSTPILMSNAVTLQEFGLDALGNAVAVYQTSLSTPSPLFGITLPYQGANWGIPVELTTDTSAVETSFSIGVDNGGNAVAVWSSSASRIQSATYTGGSWNLPFVNVTPATQQSITPVVAVNVLTGDAIALFITTIGGFQVIQSASLPFGGTWSTSFLDVSPLGNNSAEAALGFDACGNAIAVWRNVTLNRIQASTLPLSASSWTPPVTLSNAASFHPFISVSPSGYAVAVWLNAATNEIEGAVWTPTMTVTGISPGSGPAAGGTPVTITGTGFCAVSSVTFGGIPGTSATVVNPTTITVITPAAVNCTTPVPVEVFACSGVPIPGSLSFTYNSFPTPTVTNVNPAVGPTTGGTSVTITGTGFYPGATVTFGGIAGTSVVVNSTTSITVTTPAALFSNPCSVPVVVTSCGGSSDGSVHFTYNSPAPTVTSVTPNSGSPAGGTSVAIVGTNFFGVTAVQFGGVNATSFTVNSATSITATSPAGTACTTVDIRVTACGGTSGIVLGDKFTYQVSASIPTVTNLNPNTGLPAGGTSVIITGTNFLDATAVNFGATPATSFIINSATKITAVAPAAAACTVVNVTVTNCVGTSTSPATFTYSDGVSVPVVTSVNPTFGPPGTSVTINGTGFTNATSVKFGSTSASFIVVSDIKITAIAPPGVNCNILFITVTTCAGTSTTSLNGRFTNETPATVTNVSPSVGPIGQLVTITGTNFSSQAAVHAVHFGATLAPGYTVVNPTTITVDAPSPATNCETVDVTVTTCAGTTPTSIFDKYTYETEPAPTVTGVTPNSGPAGTPVTITGADFTGTTQVMFGVIPAPGFTVVDDFQISVNSPAGGINCQIDDVRVTTCIGTSPINAPADQYTYKTEPIPTVTMVSPNVGVTGTFVTITGTSFTGTEMVFFGATPAPGFNVVNDTTITVNAPAGTNCTTVEITVMTCVGTSPLNPPDDNFEYAAVPAVTNVSPNTGLPAGGTPVTITGMNFTGATAVNFGGNPATNVVVVDDTTITADSPAGPECTTVDVTVMNCAGTSPISPSDHFSYNTSVPAPVVTSVTPNTGPAAGSTAVVIMGMNFTGVLPAGVFFGATPATSFTFVSDTQIDAVSPAGTGCSTVDVRVVTCGGTSAITPNDQFTYDAVGAPTITSISPSSGSPSGGTPVTITGTNFGSSPQVHFGAALATIITFTDTSIMVTSPAGAACSTVNVTVTTCGGTSNSLPFSYTSGVSAPVVTGVSPNVGPIGQQVTITGMNFTGTTTVLFGGTPAAFVFVDDSTLTATAPISDNCDTVDITVTTCGGTSAISIFDQYTYETEPAPVVTGVSPSFGPVGQLVTITGEFFTGTAEVMFGSIPATVFSVINDSTMTAVAPVGGINCQVVDVRVTTCLGTSPANPPNDQYTYETEPVPAVSGVSPTSGPVGQAVTITGSGFIGTTMVFFGTTATTNFIVVNDNDISVVAPAASDCLVDVRVQTCVGTSAISGADEFTYTGLPVPVVTSVTPNTGPGIGGTSVVIKGMNFLGITAVDFGSVPATSFTVIDSMTIDAVSPMQNAGSCQLHVIVTGCAGTSVPSNNDIFTYVFMMANPQLVPAPVVTNVSPNTGPTAGGNMVVITGMNFTGTTSVTFGGVNVPVGQFNEINDTTITAIVPALVSGNCTVDVIVATCDGGSSTPTVLDQYTYQCRPIDPTGFTGCIIGDGFINKTSCTLGATWGASPSPNVVAYRIYRGDTIIAVIPAGAQFFFQTPLDGCTAVGFSITAVDSNGAESGHVPLVVVSQ